MRQLNAMELGAVGGGEVLYTGGIQDGDYYDPKPEGTDWMGGARKFLNETSTGVMTAAQDCSSVGQTGAIIGGAVGYQVGEASGAAVGAVIGGGVGCVAGVGIGLVRDLTKP